MKAAVIGCGRMGCGPSSRLNGQVPEGWLPISHAEALLELKDVELSALCDVNQDVLDKFGTDYNVTQLYTNYQTLIEEIKPEIITIATRTPMKKDIIEYACNNGVKGIYLEKPIATSVADCTSLLDCVKKHGVKLSYGVNRRYHHTYIQAKKMLESGEIGELTSITVEHGPAPLLWTHPHSVDLILFFSGSLDVKTIQASFKEDTVEKKDKRLIDSDPLLEVATFKFQSDLIANITTSKGLNLQLSGTEGNITIHGNGDNIQLNKKDTEGSPYFLKQDILVETPVRSATVNALTNLKKSILNSTPVDISLDEISMGIQLLMGCAWSDINRGQKISLEEIPGDLEVSGRLGDLYA